MRIPILRTALLAAALAAGSLDAQAVDTVGLLSAGRIAALPAAERQAWERYVEASRGQPDTSRASLAERIRVFERSVKVQEYLDGLDLVLAAQLPNGCWPRVYPLRGGGNDAITVGDGGMLNVLHMLLPVARGALHFVDDALLRRAEQSLLRGVDCILRTQVMVDGRRTGWSARLDPLTLAPILADAREPAGLGARETPVVLGFLMPYETSDPRVAAAVRGGAAWLRETMLWGLLRGSDGAPAPAPGAWPLWARVYEFGNRAIFTDSAGSVRHGLPPRADSAGADPWLISWPAATLAQYDEWARDRSLIPLPQTPARPNVLVDARHAGADGQVVSGMPVYRTIGAALAAAPADGARAFVIAIRNGRYREKLSIQKPNIHLIGESRDGTVLTYDVAAGHLSPGGWPYGTRGSWTLHVAAPGFRLERMTVENAFDYMANAAKPDSDSTRLRGTQAVAVMLDEGSDRAVFRDCRLSGHQDTLFPNAGRAYFQRCEILGSVDFIFGAGRAVFDDCDIVSRDRGSPSNNGYVTAPSTPIAQLYGFVFIGGRLRKETPAMAPNSVTLGRPWHPSGRPDAIGSAVFIGTWMDDHVGAQGWSPMTSTAAAGTRVEHPPEHARFFEHGTTGPGAVASPTRRVLDDEQAASYAIPLVFDGWDPRQ
jgi:pectinesterase